MTPTFAGLGCAMLRHAVTIRHKVTRVHRPFTSILVWILQSLASFVTAPGPNPAPRLPRGRGAHVATWRDRDAGTVSLRGGTCDRVGGAAAACPSLVAIHTSQNVLLEKISHDPIPSNQKEITIVSPIFKMTLPGGAGSRHDVRKSAKRPLASISLLIMKHSDYKLTAG